MKSITAILPGHVSKIMAKRLLQERAITTININHARGHSVVSGLVSEEMEVLNVIVDDSVSDFIFEFIYTEGGIQEPHGGILFVEDVAQSSHYTLADYEEHM
jgi:hypothetical protein